MKSAARIEEDLGALGPHYAGSDGALSQLRQAARRLERIAEAHPLLAEALAATDRAIIEADEAEGKIAAAISTLAHSPADLESAEARLFEVRGLARKHRVEADQLPALLEDMRTRRAAIDRGDEKVRELERALSEAEANYAIAAEQLSKARAEAAGALDIAVAGELAPLKLDAARFRTAIAPSEPSLRGQTASSLKSRPTRRAVRGLTRIASGGELSRFILALKVALAEAGGAATMIFDEVDAESAVPSQARSASGWRGWRSMPRCWSSPQPASRGARGASLPHREKNTPDGTRTTVRKLTADERREEVARMLSGAAITDEARAQAAKLLEAA